MKTTNVLLFCSINTLVSVAVLASDPGNALADANSCGVHANYFDGYYQDLSSTNKFRGTSALVNVVSPNLCSINSPSGINRLDGQSNVSSAWTMIADHRGGGYAQSGYLRYWGGSALYMFQQFERDTNDTNIIGITPGGIANVNQAYYFVQNWAARCAGPVSPCIQMKVGATILAESDFDPFGVWQEPFNPEWFGETTYRQSDVPGVPAAHVQFYDMQLEDYDGRFLPAVPPLTPRADAAAVGQTQHVYCQAPAFDGPTVQRNRAFQIWTC